jgi:tetratricopeptide (TPR) repeat protein
MLLYTHFIKKQLLFSVIFLAVYFPCQKSYASSLSGAVKGLAVDQISSFQEMQTALNLFRSCCREAKQKNQFTFSLQKLILSKSGECISRIVELEQQSNQQTKREAAKSLFSENRNVIKEILDWNQKTVEDLQENKLDQIEDTAVFFASPEWQQPHYVISLASYWLSWNNYYPCLFLPANDPARRDLLEESVEGFSRTFIDFKEDAIVIRSLFGRALCYKELQQYDRAIRDINGVIGKIKRDDALYQRSRYEKVLISYLTGNYESVLTQLKNFQDEVGDKNISPIMHTELKKLRIKTIIALSETEGKKEGKTAKHHYLDALHELKMLVGSDARQAGELYRYVNEHASTLADLPYAELGPIGYLSVADWYFNRKEYDEALLRYQRLYSSSSPLIAKRMDDVYFRLGYCFCQNNRWQDALPCFESLFKQFPRSPFTGKAACLYYAAAANHYKEQKDESTYDTYIEATKRYVKDCTEAGNKSDAHFQLGKYYQDRGKGKEAVKEFSVVGKDSPHYAEAHYFVVQANVDELESLQRRGQPQSKRVNEIYRETLKQLGEYQNLLLQQGKSTDTKELEGHVTLLQAKAYIYGPEKNYKKALDTLQHFEGKFPHNEKLVMAAAGLKIECYQKLQMLKEAQEEINRFLNEGPINAVRWAFLHERASLFYEESKQFRNRGNTIQASQQAEVALIIYKQLSTVASQSQSYERFFDPIQLRMAEIYSDENQIAAAKTLYQQQLQRDPTSADAMYNLGLLSEKEKEWEEALAIWRKFSKGFKTGSHYWFESRYHTAKVLNHLGQRDKACEITTMIEVLHPELRDDQFKEKFNSLHNEVCAKVVNRGAGYKKNERPQ